MNFNDLKYKGIVLYALIFIATMTFFFTLKKQVIGLEISTFQNSLVILGLVFFSVFLTVQFVNKHLCDLDEKLRYRLNKSDESIKNITRENEALSENIVIKSMLNEELKNEISYCETILNNLPELILVTDVTNQVVYSNNQGEKFLKHKKNMTASTQRFFNKELHLNKNEELLNSNMDCIEFQNQAFHFQKQLFDLNKRKYILTIGEDKEALNLVNQKLVKTVDQLKSADADLNLTNHKFNQLLDFISNLEDIKKIEINSFLIKVFNFLFTLIDLSDCGSVYIFENGLVKFLSAKGHDIDLLKKITIYQEDFCFSYQEGVTVTKKIINMSKEYFKKQIVEASLEIKETLSFPIMLNNSVFGVMSLDMTIASTEHFSKEDIQIAQPIEKLINVIINIVNQKEKNIKFTDDILNSFMELLSIHSQKLYRHSKNVGDHSRDFAEFLKFDDEKVNEAYWSGLMHDLGFLAIPKEDMMGSIASETFYEAHVTDAFNVMSEIKGLENVAMNILCHHENYDGSGYPNGRKGDEIPMISQIIALINYYDYSIYIKNDSFKTFFKALEEKRNTAFESKLIDQLIEWVKENENI